MSITINSLKLHPGQKRIVDKIINTPHIDGQVDYHTVVCSRQWGKSVCCTQLMLYYAISEPGSKVLFISMTFQQSGKVFNTMVRGIEKSGIISKKNAIENSIILKNGSEIYCRSYQRADYIRGLSATTLLIDESSWVKDEDWQSVFRPTLATAGKRCILFSTPKNDNWFKTMYDRGMSDKYSNYHSYHSTWRENPYANISEIEDAKSSLPEKIYKAEYEAEFVNGAYSVFKNYRNCLTGTFNSGAIIAAIDVGNADDYSVLTIMNGNKVISINRWRHDTFENIIKEMVKVMTKEKVRQVWCEVNSLGSPFFEFLCNEVRNHRLNIQMEPWITSNTSKQNAVEKLINDFAMNNIIIPDNKDLLEELDHFSCEYSNKSKAVIYGGQQGFHDDIIMSLCICNYNRSNAPTGSYHVAISRGYGSYRG